MRRSWWALAATAAIGAAWRRRSRRGEALGGQVALITGGSRGLGLLLAKEPARAGCKVVICARDPVELELARRELEGLGADVLARPCDVSDRAEVERLVADALERFGAIDILVNNAGIIQVGPLASMTAAALRAASPRLARMSRAFDHTLFWPSRRCASSRE